LVAQIKGGREVNYLEMNSWFVLPILVLYFLRFKTSRLCYDRIPLLLLMLMTAVFDNLIVLAKIVSYDESKISGLKVLVAPIEDFAYTLVLVPLIALVQSYFTQWQSRRKETA
jgi:lycopene cyclase domain-containing protein